MKPYNDLILQILEQQKSLPKNNDLIIEILKHNKTLSLGNDYSNIAIDKEELKKTFENFLISPDTIVLKNSELSYFNDHLPDIKKAIQDESLYIGTNNTDDFIKKILLFDDEFIIYEKNKFEICRLANLKSFHISHKSYNSHNYFNLTFEECNSKRIELDLYIYNNIEIEKKSYGLVYNCEQIKKDILTKINEHYLHFKNKQQQFKNI